MKSMNDILLTELSEVQLMSASHEFSLKSQVRFQAKITLHEVLLPNNYIYFENTFL